MENSLIFGPETWGILNKEARVQHLERLLTKKQEWIYVNFFVLNKEKQHQAWEEDAFAYLKYFDKSYLL